MSREWYKYQTYESWAGLLQELLQEAQQAVDSNDSRAKESVLSDLDGFIDNSPMSIPQTKELDEIAEKAMRAIWEDTAARTLGILRQDLSRIQRVIYAATHDAQAGNLSRRYELIGGVVDSTNETIRGASEVARSLKDGPSTNEELASDIEKLISAIQKLRDKVELASK